MVVPDRARLLEDLREFLEVHLKSKIPGTDGLGMYVKFVHSQASKPKDKMISYLLLRAQERLLDRTPDEKDLIVCEFLISEMRGYYKELKSPSRK